MTRKYAALSLILTGLYGCASGPSPQPNLPDSLTAHINNDSTGTMLMRSAAMYTYANARCEGGERRANKMSMASQEALTTIPVTPGVPLTFALTTLNAQSFKGNWGCTFTSTFTPVAGARYEAVLQTEDDNRTCRVVILDQNKNPVPATKPDYSCDKTMAGFVKNGQRYTPAAVKIPLYVSVPR
jgi:hypothetical protein